MNDPATNGDGAAKGRALPQPIVISRPGAVLHTTIIPLEGELRDSLTTTVKWIGLPLDDDPPRRRWWERLAWAWRGL
ncbi:MAG TPA: hypothetical protein VGC13_12610 [Longimicrobium sp.]|jgi:hypothetical protein